MNLPLPSTESTLVVPKSAIVNSTESIFVIRAVNNKAEWIPVKEGREANGMVEIYGNLSMGDTLVKTASDEIRNGSALGKVKIVKN